MPAAPRSPRADDEPAPNIDRAQLAALGVDARARALAARLERVRRERETRAADHWAD